MYELYYIEQAESRGEMDILYSFTSIVAESDSIGEGHGYCSEYTKEMFDEEVSAIKNSEESEYGYLEYAGINIYAVHLAAIGGAPQRWELKYIKGDLVRDAEEKFDVFGHGCNCFCTMGAGIAAGVKNTWPEAYQADLKTDSGDREKLGTYSKWSNDNITVLNMYTQYDFKGRGNKADYVAIRKCMKNLRRDYAGKKIALPLIGAGLAGGDWGLIESIIKQELWGEDVTVVVWENTQEQWQLDLLEKEYTI